jgi:hypothetical protein
MTEKTPLEKLDDAVHEFIAATTDEGNRAVAGWALGIETSAINPDPELGVALMDAQHYVSGPQTTSAQAIGLAEFVASVYRTYITRQTLDED